MTSPTPAHLAIMPRSQRLSPCVLLAGAVLSVAAAFGPVWVVRAGIALALIAGVIGCLLAWHDLTAVRRQHSMQNLATGKAHGAALTEERRQHTSVLDTLTDWINTAQAGIESQRIRIGQLTAEISALRGDNAFLKGEVSQREVTIASLRETVAARETELRALTGADDGTDAEIMALPRRVKIDACWQALPTAEEPWADGTHPTVVDLRTLEAALVLPNFEVDQRLQA